MLPHLFLGFRFISKALKLGRADRRLKVTGITIHSFHLVKVRVGEGLEEGIAGHGLELLQVEGLQLAELLGARTFARRFTVNIIFTVWGKLLNINNYRN